MTLQSSGAISTGDIRTELGLTGTISLNDSIVRALLGKSSGAISLSDGYGKSAYATTPGTPYYTSITQTTFTINWSASSNVSSYIVKIYIGSAWYTYSTTTGLSVNVTAADPNTTYYFAIVAVSQIGYETWGAYAGLTTLPNLPGTPGTPTYTSVTSTKVTLNWTASSGVVDYYYIYIWNGSSWDYIGYTYGLSLVVSGLNPNTTYYFYVVAYNTAGNTPGSYSSVTTLP